MGLLARYEKMLKENGKAYFDADEWEEIAFQYEVAEKFKEALTAVEYGLSMHPGNIPLSVKKARYLLDTDAVDEAEDLIYSLPNNSEEALLIRIEIHFIHHCFREGENLIRRLLAEEEVTCDLCLRIMDLYIDFGYFDEAVDFVDEADRILPNSTDLLSEMALLCEEKQRYDKAVELYNRLIDRNPYSTVDWFNLAKVYALQKKYDKAVDACDFALTTKEDDKNILSFKGYCLYDMGAYREAVAVFLEYAEFAEEKAVAYELISECYVKLNQLEKSVDYLLKALAVTPENSNLYYQLACNYYDMGDYSEAETALLKTIELDPYDAGALSFLGELKMNEGTYDEAYRYLMEAYEIDPHNVEVLIFLGDILAQDNPGEAVSFYEKALEVNPYDVKLIFRLIMAYYNAGNEEKTVELIKHLDETTLKIDDIDEILEGNKWELRQTREMLEKLKDILRNSLGENL